jgi:hypothetical protein
MIERAIRLHIYGPNYAGGEPLGYRVGIRDTDAPGSFMTCNEARDLAFNPSLSLP